MDRTDGDVAPQNISSRKRGHQHHIRNEGTRRSHVPADEVIAALRAGNALTANDDGFDSSEMSSSQYSDIEMQSTIDGDNNILSSEHTRIDDDDDDEFAMYDDDNGNRDEDNNRNIKIYPTQSVTKKILADSTTERLNELNVTNDSGTSVPLRSGRTAQELNEMTDSMSSSSSSGTKKLKTKRDGTKKSNKAAEKVSDPNAVKKEKRKRTKATPAPPKEERPPLEGAADDSVDIENDPEVAEWSKLRCTSERTEVVAEREHRRKNRCADYPGLAFGRSIFSSDTMMKLNIIRNELHNIMKTQLKRV